MEKEDIAKTLVGSALLRLKQFADFIAEAIGHQIRNNIYTIANHGLEAKIKTAESVGLIAEQILRKIKRPDYMVRKLIAFGDHEVAFNLLYVALHYETQNARSFWKFRRPLVLRHEDKNRLINFCLADQNEIRLFANIRFLLNLAKVIPYESQQKLLLEYLMLQDRFTTPADFLDVYDMWRDLSPDLRERLRQLMKSALMYTRFKLWREKRSGPMGVDVVENMAEEVGSKPDSN